MNIAPSIGFRPIGASLHIGRSATATERRVLVLSVELAPREDVKTSDKRSLRDADWIIRLLENKSSTQSADSAGPIGRLSHLPESASPYDHDSEGCQADIALDPDTFSSLLTAVQAGRIPNWLSIKVKDLEYGTDPDGRDKLWDVASHRNVSIVEVTFRIPLVAPLRSERALPDTNEGSILALPATAADIRTLREQLVSTSSAQQRSSQQLLAILVVLVLVSLLVVLFK